MEIVSKAGQTSEGLLKFSEKLLVETNWKKTLDKYRELLNNVTPEFALDIFTQFSCRDWPIEKIMLCISKLSNVFYKPLLNTKRNLPSDNFFLNYLMTENQKLNIVISEIKSIIKDSYRNNRELSEKVVLQLQSLLPGLQMYKLHHLKEERLLFQVFQNLEPAYKPYFKIEEHFHKEYNRIIHGISNTFKSIVPDKHLLNQLLGKLCFITFLMIFREEHIFYPVAVDVIPDETWDELMSSTLNAEWL